jgi:hypothetical protein
MSKGAYDVFTMVMQQKKKASLGQKFDKIVGQVWFKEKSYCLYQR